MISFEKYLEKMEKKFFDSRDYYLLQKKFFEDNQEILEEAMDLEFIEGFEWIDSKLDYAIDRIIRITSIVKGRKQVLSRRSIEKYLETGDFQALEKELENQYQAEIDWFNYLYRQDKSGIWKRFIPNAWFDRDSVRETVRILAEMLEKSVDEWLIYDGIRKKDSCIINGISVKIHKNGSIKIKF